MPLQRVIQTNFTGGEVSPRLYGRVDTAKYQNGAKTIENFIVTPYGGVKRRTGSLFKWRVKTHSEKARLVRFQYSTDQAYVIQLGPSYMRFYTPSGGIVIEASATITGISQAATAVVTYSGADIFANGDRIIISGVVGMYEVNNREYTVANLNAGANTFELSGVNSSAYTAYSSGGTASIILEVAHTYTESELPQLRFAQSNDTLFIAHKSHALAQLVRNSATSWTLSDFANIKGPWRPLNRENAITIKANDFSGSVTIEASAALFDADMVGGIFKLFSPGQSSGETEWGSEGNPAASTFWAYNGNVYECQSSSGSDPSSRYPPPTHQSGSDVLYKAGSTSTNPLTLVFEHKGFGIVTLSGYTSTTVMTGTVYSGYGYSEIPAGLVDSSMTGGAASNARYRSATSFWQEGAWSTYRGNPSLITFFEQRFMAAANTSQTQTIWGSVTGDFVNFEEGSDDAQALNYTIGSEESDAIRWMVSAKQLIIGTTSGEYVMTSSSQQEAVTPSNIKISRETKYGSAPAEPIRVAGSVIFVQRRGNIDNAGRKIREMAYDFQTDSFQSAELSIWSEHITGTGVEQLEYQSDPDGLIWGRRTDGRACACTFQKEQQVVAWHKHFLGGYSDAGHTEVPVIESVVTVPGTDGDELWMVVRRYINGATVRYIEVLAHYDEFTAQEDAVFLDSAVLYDGSPTTTIDGYQHLAGETISILADGAKRADVVVSAFGRITLGSNASKVVGGYKYKSTLQTLDFEAGAREGSSQGVPKRISKMTLRLDRSLGGYYGPSSDRIDPIQYRTTSDVMGNATDLFTGDQSLDLPSTWKKEASVYLETEDPFPMNVIAVVASVTATG